MVENGFYSGGIAIPIGRFPFPIRFAKKGGFIYNVATMLAGNTAAQIITFLAAPVITRLYVPDDFGIMTYISSLIAIFSVFATLRYENAIVLPEKEKSAFNLLVLCILSAVVVAILSSLMIIFWGEQLTVIIEKSWLWPWLWFVPIGVLLQGLFNSLTYVHTRRKNFPSLSLARIANSAGAVIIKIFLGILLGSTALGLIGGNLCGFLVAVVMLGWIFLSKDYAILKRHVSLQGIVRAAKEYNKFPIYALPTGLLNRVSQNLPVLLLAYFFSQDVVGYFGLANAVLRKPISLMGESLSKVYLQKAADLDSKGINLRNSMVKATLGLGAIGIVPFGVLAIGGRGIFSFFFGQEWAASGIYAQILAPWLFFGFINPPAVQIIIIKQALRFSLFYNIITMIMRIISIVLGYYLFSKPWVVIAAFSACGVCVNMFYISYAYVLTKSEQI